MHLVDKPIPFLNSFTWALPSVIAANIWQMLGFYMIILLTGLQNIPGNLYEAAEIDGANAIRRFLRITLPLLRPSIFLCFVIGMLNSVTSFDLVYVMTGGGPGRATEILVTYIYKLGFIQTRFDYAAAVTVVFFLLLLGRDLGRQPPVRRQCRRRGARLMKRYPRWPIHLALLAVSFVMLVPFYWVLKTSVSGENIFSYPPSIIPHDPNPFFYVDVWYAIPFARFFLNSVVVSAHDDRRQRGAQRHGRIRADRRASAASAWCCCCSCPA